METSSERSSRARLAALQRWARLDPLERQQATAPARRAFLEKFQMAPNPPAALRAHMARMAHRSRRRL